MGTAIGDRVAHELEGNEAVLRKGFGSRLWATLQSALIS